MTEEDQKGRIAAINIELEELNARREKSMLQITTEGPGAGPQRRIELVEQLGRIAQTEFELRQERYRLLLRKVSLDTGT